MLGERDAEKEPARFEAGDQVEFYVLERLVEGIERELEAVGVV